MERSAITRWAPLTGVLYGLLFIIAFGTSASVSDDASGAELVKYYNDHHSGLRISGFVMVVTGVAFAFFAGAVRDALRRRDSGPDWLPTVAFGGGVAYAVALALFAVTQNALVRGADLQTPELMRTLKTLDRSIMFPAMVGMSVFLLAAGTAAIRSKALPAWLAWIAAVLGVLAFMGPLGFAAFFALPFIAIPTGIVLSRRAGKAISALEPDEPVLVHTS